MLKIGDLVRTIKGNIALISNIDEVIIDRWGEERVSFVSLIYCDTSIENCYCDASYLKLVSRGEK